jgi:molybdopterin molybdotransferase
MQRTVETHLADVLAGIEPLAPFELGLMDARGCRLAEDVIAPVALPAFSSAACEGFAVTSKDVANASRETAPRLLVVDEVQPGFRPRLAVVSGAAVRVHLGSALPEGADAVVPIAGTEPIGNAIDVVQAVRAGDFVRLAGTELKSGDVVLKAGTRINARRIALLAATGIGTVVAHPRPRVVIVTIGDELVDAGRKLQPGIVADSNGVMLSALVQQAGAVAYRVGPLADNADQLQDVLADQLVRADLVIVAGGVSASAYETTQYVAAQLGEMAIHRVAMSPGAAQGFGHLGEDRTPMLTLPGHPAAAFVAFEVFVRPVILRMAGAPNLGQRLVKAQLQTAITSLPGKRQFIPSVHTSGADGVNRVHPLHSEHITAELAQADCLLVVPEAVTDLNVGDFVDVVQLDGGAW